MASYCYMDIDIGDNRASYKRCCKFVGQNSIKYGLSSTKVKELGGREKLSINELYLNDYNWSKEGKCIVNPQQCTRIVFELFTKEAPNAVENFQALCTGSKGKSKSNSTINLSYKGSKLHRYVPGFMIQGGDFIFGNGSGGESIWGKKFKDDPLGLKLKHNSKGILSMGNSGKNSNSSQFFITLGPAPHCDKKHVVFGKILYGLEVLDLIQDSIKNCSDLLQNEAPPIDLIITDCGIWTDGDPIQGYWNEDDVFVSNENKDT